MQEQKILLEETFTKWVGAHEQIDDVTVIGIRIYTKSKYNIVQFMTGKFFIIRAKKRRHSLSYVEYF
jgi:hypothetical protein